MPPTAIILNMYYTGLGIARSLGERGVPVIGLTAHKGVYGNYTRYARIASCPDSRHEPEALLDFLLSFRTQAGSGAVLFATRDDDVMFLDRYRDRLSEHYRLVGPESAALRICLDKWATYLAGREAGIPAPRCWRIDDEQDLQRVLDEAVFPCVLKPVQSHHWRGANWTLVRCRKAIGVSSRAELRAEYALVSRANKSAVVQEFVPGDDDRLLITACFVNRKSECVAAFNTRKLLQVPERFGTGCIVQAVDGRPEIVEPTARLLKHIGFSGIAEVEYKWDEAAGEFKLIEINPRCWDQHRLGVGCGTDLAYLAYCEAAGLPEPSISRRPSSEKWIAEDSFITAALRLAWTREGSVWKFLRLAHGRRIYAIWSARDPLPFLAYMSLSFVPGLVASSARAVLSTARQRAFSRFALRTERSAS